MVGGAVAGAVEPLAGEGFFVAEDFFVGALENDVAAGFAVAGAEIDDLVGGAHDGGFVFDDDDGVAGGTEALEDLDEAGGVAGVKADAGFVEDEEGVHEARTEAGGEVDAFGFAAGKGACGAIEGEIAEANFFEVAEAGADFVQADEEWVVGVAGFEFLGGGVDEGEGALDGELVEVGEREFIGCEEERIGLEAFAFAFGAGGVGAVAGEEDAHVHFVGFGFEVAEVAFDAVPGAGPFVGGVFAVIGVAFDEEGLDFGREVLEGNVDWNFALFADAEEIVLGFGARFGLPWFDAAFGDGEGAIGNGEVVIDADDAAEAFAGGAGADGVVEAEERGGGLAIFDVALGTVEAVGKLAALRGIGEVDGEAAFAEVVGLFAGFGEAGAVLIH